MKDYQLYDTLFEAVAVLDKNGKIIYSNHFFSTLFKVSPRVIKKLSNLFQLFSPDGPFPKELFDRIIKEPGSYVSKEIELITEEQATNSHVVLKLSTLEDNNVLICFNNISIEKKLYNKYRTQLNELKDSHLQILQADKLSTIGELSAGISHEISNPLTIAAGNIEILEEFLGKEQLTAKDVIETCLRDITDAHNRITSIILNMKTFLHSKTQEEEEREYVDLKQVILESIKLVTPSYRNNEITINTAFKEDDIIGLINKVKIEQVLVNLLSNALDALVDSDTKNPTVTIELKKARAINFLEIRVSDNGPGVDNANKTEIFNTFFTTKDIGEGTGLGLPIANQIIEAHQGTLILEDSKKGASFLIQLPFIEILSYTQNEINHRSRDYQHKDSIRVMVVDNEVQVLNVLNKIFADEGIIFMGSVNGIDALELLQEITVDLIITDYLMPQMNGSEFSQKIRDLNIDCPILYLSSAANQDHFQRDKEKLDISGMILKPFTKEEVLKGIYGALGKIKES